MKTMDVPESARRIAEAAVDGGSAADIVREFLERRKAMMYEPPEESVPDVAVPERYYPQPDYGDYEYPVSMGMMSRYPVGLSYGVPGGGSVEVPQEGDDYFSPEAMERRAVKQRYAESAFNDRAVSRAGARGAWQIMPITYRDYLGRGRGKAGNLNDPEYNRKVRDWVMGVIPRDLGEFYSESDAPLTRLAKIYGAYNWGAGNMRSYLRKQRDRGVDISNGVDWVEGLNPETRRYIKYLAFDEDIPDSTMYTNGAFEKAALERGYLRRGGPIRIKPENRGKFTALKKRTGHSASWFKAHGTPAQKKMAVFALNARKWKHGDGGFLHQYDGETEDTQQMERVPNWTVFGRDYSTWKPSDVQGIIDWGYTDPESFFGEAGASTRDALSRAGMADSVIGDIYANMDPELQARFGDRYKGTAQRQREYDQGIRDYTGYVAPRLAGVMAGSLLGAEGLSLAAPWMVDVAAPAVQRFMATPAGRIISTTFDTAGTIDGIRNAFSENGVRKTIGFLKDHNYGRAALSGLGDVFDVAGGIGYAKGAGKRFAESVLRMGDEARSAGSFKPVRAFREAFNSYANSGKKPLDRMIEAVKQVNEDRKNWGHLSKQVLDKNTLNYIFNPYAGIINPDLKYNMPINYSGDAVGNARAGKHVYDRIDDFLGNTQPENMEWVNVDDLPEHIRQWAKDRYPKMKQIRVSNMGEVDNYAHIPIKDATRLEPGGSVSVRDVNGDIRRKVPDGPNAEDWKFVSLLDPGHHGVTYSMAPDGTLSAVGDDVYKYNAKDWLRKWKQDFQGKMPERWKTPEQKNWLDRWMDKRYGEDFSNLSLMGKAKYFGLKFLDDSGSPIIFKWDYKGRNVTKPADSAIANAKKNLAEFAEKAAKNGETKIQPHIDDVTGDVIGFYDSATGNGVPEPSWWKTFEAPKVTHKPETGSEKLQDIVDDLGLEPIDNDIDLVFAKGGLMNLFDGESHPTGYLVTPYDDSFLYRPDGSIAPAVVTAQAPVQEVVLPPVRKEAVPRRKTFLESVEPEPVPVASDSFIPHSTLLEGVPLEVDKSLGAVTLPERDSSAYFAAQTQRLEDKQFSFDPKGKTRDEIKEVQQGLADHGYYSSLLNGKSKDEIKEIQRRLVSRGFLSAEKREDGTYKEVDGIVGKKTREAWNRYNVDGYWGARSNAALEASSRIERGARHGNWKQDVSAEGVDGCAQWVTKKYESVVGNVSKSNGVIGNAWNMPQNIVDAGGQMLFNLYDHGFEDVKDADQLKKRTRERLGENQVNYDILKPGDVVGVFVPRSEFHQETLDTGTTYNTHVGIVVGIDKDGMPLVEHNINQRARTERADRLGNGAYSITVASRPKQGGVGTYPFEMGESKYEVEFPEWTKAREKEGQVAKLKTFMDSMAGAAPQIGEIYGNADMDAVQRIAVAVLGRETDYMQNAESVRTGKAGRKVRREQALRKFFGTDKDPEKKSSDLTKFKLSTLTPDERTWLGIRNASDLEDPAKAGRASLLVLAKNYDYFVRYAKENPQLGLTKQDIEDLTALSYNQGMSRLYSVGTTKDEGTGELFVAPGKLEEIRRAAENEDPISDFSATKPGRAADKYPALTRLMKAFYYNGILGDRNTSYMNSARQAIRNVREKRQE